MDSLAPLPEKSQMLDHSQDTLTQRTAENTTSALKALPVSTDAQSELSSRLEILTVQETAKDQKMFPDGKFPILQQLHKYKTTTQIHQTVINRKSVHYTAAQMLNNVFTFSLYPHPFTPQITEHNILTHQTDTTSTYSRFNSTFSNRIFSISLLLTILRMQKLTAKTITEISI